jgi:hypothetical protein
VALNGFAVAGLNVTATVQVLFGAVNPIVAFATHVVPVPETIAKSAGLVPPSTTVLRFRTAVPVFVNVTVCAGLVVI